MDLLQAGNESIRKPQTISAVSFASYRVGAALIDYLEAGLLRENGFAKIQFALFCVIDFAARDVVRVAQPTQETVCTQAIEISEFTKAP